LRLSGATSKRAGTALTEEERVMLSGTLSTNGARWRNLITGECRDSPPQCDELDWIEITTGTAD
jgi:hypothetical protein